MIVRGRRTSATLALGVALGSVLGVLTGPAERALACTCLETTLAEFVAQYPEAIVAAFTGTQTDRVVEDELADGGAVLTFDVDTVYAGDVGASIEVRTHAQSSACGLDFDGFGLVSLTATDFGGGPGVNLCSSRWPAAELEAQYGPGREPADVPPGSPPTQTGPIAGPDAEDGPRLLTRVGLGVVLLVVAGAALVVVRRGRDDDRAGPDRQ